MNQRTQRVCPAVSFIVLPSVLNGDYCHNGSCSQFCGKPRAPA